MAGQTQIEWTASLVAQLGVMASVIGAMLLSLWWAVWDHGRATASLPHMSWFAPPGPVRVDWYGFEPEVVFAHIHAFNQLIGCEILVPGRELDDPLVPAAGHGFIRLIADDDARFSDVRTDSAGKVLGVSVRVPRRQLRAAPGMFAATVEHELGMSLGLGSVTSARRLFPFRSRHLSAREVRALQIAYARKRCAACEASGQARPCGKKGGGPELVVLGTS